MAKAKSSKREFYITFFIIVAAYPFSMRENPDVTATLVLCSMFTFSTWMQNVAQFRQLQMNPLKNSLRPVGVLITLVAGVLQYVFWFVAWADWLGVFGVILGFILTPGVVIFPIIYWIVEGEFPTLYFALMFAGWFGLRLKRSQRVQAANVSFGAGEIISYRQMCDQENASLQRGMNYRLSPTHSVVLMSVRSGAPYDDEVLEDGRVLLYEGHDVPQSKLNPIPKFEDQVLNNPGGSLTENGKFFEAAKQFKEGSRPPEAVKVYEKIKSGIWAFSGTFSLIDASPKQSGGRRVFKFKLMLVDLLPPFPVDPNVKPYAIQISHNRIIPSTVKQAVWKRDQGKCIQCGSKDNLHFDHILPFSKGGSSVLVENIQLLCARHNLQKSDKLI